MAQKILWSEKFTINASINPIDIQQEIADLRSPQPRLDLLVEDDGHLITDAWPVDGNVTVEIGKRQPEGRTITVIATEGLRLRTDRSDAPGVASHAKTIIGAIRSIKVVSGKARSGRNQDACNVWLEHIVLAKGYTARTDKPEGNKIFELWRQLNEFETPPKKDNDEAAWDRYTKAVERIRGKNIQ